MTMRRTPCTYATCLSASKTNKQQTPSLLQNDIFLAIRYHIAAPDNLDNTVQILPQLSTYHIGVLPLSSGKCGAVSGEVHAEILVACSASFLRLSERFSRSRCTQALVISTPRRMISRYLF
jgi:hypothetical protein